MARHARGLFSASYSLPEFLVASFVEGDFLGLKEKKDFDSNSDSFSVSFVKLNKPYFAWESRQHLVFSGGLLGRRG